MAARQAKFDCCFTTPPTTKLTVLATNLVYCQCCAFNRCDHPLYHISNERTNAEPTVLFVFNISREPLLDSDFVNDCSCLLVIELLRQPRLRSMRKCAVDCIHYP